MRRSHRGSPVALPGFSTLMDRWEEPVIPLHSLDTAVYAIWAYLLPCNHRKACRETKWTMGNTALPATSKQISLSIEAPLNSGTLCMVQDGKWATTQDSTLFGQEVRPYFPPGLTFVQLGAEECVCGSRRKLKVSVLSANLKKCRFCNFSGSYTKRSPLE